MNMKIIMIYSYLFQIRVWSQPDKINQTEYAIGIISQCFKFFTEYFNITDVLNKTGNGKLIANFYILITCKNELAFYLLTNLNFLFYKDFSLKKNPEIKEESYLD